jgi:hypothetical protein
MQYRAKRSPTPLPSLTAFDEEFKGTTQTGPERPFQPKRLHGTYAALLIAGVVLGAISLVSTAPQLWSFVQAMASSPAQRSQTQVSTLTPDLLGQMNLLKEQLRELRESQQQTSASLANLHLDHQELRRSVIQTGSWYSEPNLVRQGWVPRPSVPDRPRQVSARRRPTLQQANAESPLGIEPGH